MDTKQGMQVMKMEFLEEFKPEYQRNNKRKGRKHLRCFPRCKVGGHVDNNFCGRPVSVEVTFKMPTNSVAWSENLVSFVEFRPLENRPAIMQGQSTAVIGEHWIPGLVSAVQIADAKENLYKAQIEFNSDQKTWQYLWQSHRMTANTPHVLDVFVGTLVDESYFLCRGQSHSPSFKLFCRKKANGTGRLYPKQDKVMLTDPPATTAYGVSVVTRVPSNKRRQQDSSVDMRGAKFIKTEDSLSPLTYQAMQESTGHFLNTTVTANHYSVPYAAAPNMDHSCPVQMMQNRLFTVPYTTAPPAYNSEAYNSEKFNARGCSTSLLHNANAQDPRYPTVAQSQNQSPPHTPGREEGLRSTPTEELEAANVLACFARTGAISPKQSFCSQHSPVAACDLNAFSNKHSSANGRRPFLL